MLSATIGSDNPARILIVGAGGGAQEIVTASAMGPKWRFTAVDPSKPMMDIAVARLAEKGLAERTDFHLGYVDDLPTVPHIMLGCTQSAQMSKRRPNLVHERRRLLESGEVTAV